MHSTVKVGNSTVKVGNSTVKVGNSTVKVGTNRREIKSYILLKLFKAFKQF